MIEFPVAELLDTNIDVLDFKPDTWDGNLFIAHLPSSPDLAVMLMPTGGPTSPGSATLGYDDQTIQVMVRGGSHDPTTPYDLGVLIFNELQGLRSIYLGDTWLVHCKALQIRPESLGQDANERYRFTQNFNFHVRNQTKHRE